MNRNINISPTNSPGHHLPNINTNMPPNTSRQSMPNLLNLETSVILCTICLEVVENNRNKKTLRCNHHFHADCINRWLRSRPHCPICRRPSNTRTNAQRAVVRERIASRNRYNLITNNTRQRPNRDNSTAARRAARELRRNGRLGVPRNSRAGEYNMHYVSSPYLIT